MSRLSRTRQSPADGCTLQLSTIGFAANVGPHGSVPTYDPAKEFATHIKAKIEQWRKIAQHTGIRID